MPVRSLTPSVLRWPDPDQVIQATRHWAERQAADHPGLIAEGRGSDLDLVLIDRHARGLQRERLPQWPLELLPLACDALVLTPGEWQALQAPADGVPDRMATTMQRECRWLWERS